MITPETLKLATDMDDITYMYKFINNPNIVIFDSIERSLHRDVPRSLLYKVNKDLDTAIELCLIFATQFTNQLFIYNRNIDSKKSNQYILEQNKNNIFKNSLIRMHKFGINLHSNYLKDNYGDVYIHILNVLLYDVKKKAIIKIDGTCTIGIKSRTYFLNNKYIIGNKKLIELKTKKGLKRKISIYSKYIDRNKNNEILKSIFKFYNNVDTLTYDEVLAQYQSLILNKSKDKHGQLYAIRGTKSRSSDNINYVYFEDHYKMYLDFIAGKYMLPKISAKAGGRIAHVFNLIPSTIRDILKIDDTQLVDVDYKSLHPNIISKIYGDSAPLNHQTVADYLNIDIKIAKIEHLSFFNKNKYSMMQSPLWKYYNDNHPILLNNILEDKKINGYKYTSKLLLTMEVNMMYQVITKLNNMGITLNYVYDGLGVLETDSKLVQRVMQDVADKFEVKTIAIIK